MSPCFVILALWILRISSRACSLGSGISIFRSSRPERISAGSRMSALFVAAITCNNELMFMAYSSIKAGSHAPGLSRNQVICGTSHTLKLDMCAATSASRHEHQCRQSTLP